MTGPRSKVLASIRVQNVGKDLAMMRCCTMCVKGKHKSSYGGTSDNHCLCTLKSTILNQQVMRVQRRRPRRRRGRQANKNLSSGPFHWWMCGVLYKHFMFHSYYQAKFNPSKMINNFQLARMQKQSRSIHQKPYISLIRGVS